MKPVASVIIPALNAEGTIGAQLEALSRQDFPDPWEVVVVDNGSTDGTVQVCHTCPSHPSATVRVVTCPEPGTGAARNLGAGTATAELLLFCDADDEVDPGWVTGMVAGLQDHAAVGGRIENDRLNGDRPAYMPRHPDRLPVVAGFLPRAIAASLGVRRAAFEDVGGFSPEYTYGSGDTEFCWRLQLAGYALGYVPDAVVHYRHRSTLRSVAEKAFKTQRGGARLYRDYRDHGMRQPRLLGAAARWGRLALSTPALPFSPRLRWWWAEQAAGAAGRVAGSIKFGVRYL